MYLKKVSVSRSEVDTHATKGWHLEKKAFFPFTMMPSLEYGNYKFSYLLYKTCHKKTYYVYKISIWSINIRLVCGSDFVQ